MNRQLFTAAGAWLYDVAKNYPKTLRGKHYWSLSWLPDHQRSMGQTTDDTTLLSTFSHLIQSSFLAVPKKSSLLETCEDSLFATVCYLCASNLSLISVWSPTFALELLHIMSRRREEISSILSRGKWQYPLKIMKNLKKASVLKQWDGKLEGSFFEKLWPDLALISAWDSASSKDMATKLKSLFPKVSFQRKGLWATEGVVSIPINDHSILAANSHFFEFKDLASGELIPCWELEKGAVVQPVLTTGSGLLRYQLDDRVLCTGHMGKLPQLEFLGRIGGVDMLGEKLDIATVGKYLKKMRLRGIPALSLVGKRNSAAHSHSRPGYELLCDIISEEEKKIEQNLLENHLRKNHHYALARDLGQLQAVKIISSKNPLKIYHSCNRNSARGQIKIEDLIIES